MAKDLIPPPSPAGRPGEEDEQRSRPGEPRRPFDDIGADAPVAPATALTEARAAEPAAPPAPLPRRHRTRFALLGGLVVGLGLAVVAVFVLALAGGGGPAKDGWSAWAPTTSDTYPGARQIAAHVGPEYRRDDGGQLVQVEAGPLKVSDVPLDVVTARSGGDITPVKGKGVWFVMNGLGPKGSISTGAPTNQRGALVQREALELSLYAFKYLDRVDYVVTLLPPPKPGAKLEQGGRTVTVPADPPLRATLYRRDDLDGKLRVPLRATIATAPPQPKALSALQAQVLGDQLAPHAWTAGFTQSQTGQGYLLLER